MAKSSAWRRFSLRQQGFTLLEILLVVVIIAVMAGLASLAIGGNETRLLQQEAERLQQVLLMAQDEAAFQQRNLGLKLSATGYGFFQYNDVDGDWLEMTHKPFQQHHFELPMHASIELDGARLELGSKGDSKTQAPEVLFLASGESSAFILELALVQSQTPPKLVYSDGFSPVAIKTANSP